MLMHGSTYNSPLIRVFHNSPTTHHNPPQLTITRHNSPQVPEVQVVVATTHHNVLSQFSPLHASTTTCYNLPQPTQLVFVSAITCHNSPQLTTTSYFKNSPQLTTTHHNSPQFVQVTIQKVKKQCIFKHISIWLSGLRGQALGEVVSGLKPGFVEFHVFVLSCACGFSFAICNYVSV